MKNGMERLEELTDILSDACQRYYAGTDDEESLLSDIQYDKLLSELYILEEKTGTRLQNSPTQRIGCKEDGDKVQHVKPILSLKSTKSIDDLVQFLGDSDGILSWKLDGVSIVLYYVFGNLVQALSRGDGKYGKDITENVFQIRYIPKTIPIKNNIVVRGEGVMRVREFDALKKTKEGERFRNPRNLTSGLVNATKTSSLLLRHVDFIAHTAVVLNGKSRKLTTRSSQLAYLKTLGFKTVPHIKTNTNRLQENILSYTNKVMGFEYPVDGLVLALEDIAYGDSLGGTAKWPKHSLAYKWPDISVQTKVTGMKWSVSKTGLITPVVIFEPVMLEGTEVRQANLHNLKIFKELKIGNGDELIVYKANKIIPTVETNLTQSATASIPVLCPVCNEPTRIVKTELTEKLYCDNCKGDK